MDKYRKLVSNTIVFTIGSFSQKILVLLLVKFYTGILSPAEYGITDLIAQTANFIIPIATLSIGEGIIRFGLDKNYNKSKVFTSGVFTIIFGMTVLALLTPIFNLFHIFDGYGFLLYIYIYTSSFRTLCAQFVRSRGLVKLYAFDGILTTIVLIGMNILLLLGLKMGAVGYILSIVISDACSVIFLTIAAGLPKFINFKAINWDFLKSMLKYSVPLIPTAVLWMLISVSDRYFITGMIGLDANGIYTAANKIPQMIAVVSAFFSQAWHMSAITENNKADTERFYTNVFGAYQSTMYVMTAGLLLVLKPITDILLDKQYHSAYQYSPMLILGIMFMCYGSFLSSVYAATKHTKNSLVTSLVAGITNIVLNIILIPKWGIQGAAFATLISYGLCYIIRVFDTRRYIHFKVNFGVMLINVSILVGMTYVAINQPKSMYLWLAGGFTIIVLLNFGALIKTLKRVFGKSKG